MENLTEKDVKHYSESKEYFQDLIQDIKNAQKNIYIEAYKFEGKIAREITEQLVESAKRGVEVKLLLDHWGTTSPANFFKELKTVGGEIRFFKVFKFRLDLISYNNKRDHRKIVLIDNEITYIGSANITEYSKAWREFIVRMRNKTFAKKIKEVFLDNYKIHNFFFHSAKKHIKPIKFETLEIIRDVPSLRFQKIRNKHIHLIMCAKREVLVETPYFVPDLKTLKALFRGAKRGLDIKLIIPKKSDMKIVDVFVQSLFGKLHKRGVKILFYKPNFSHAKITLIDRETFSYGSSNFDYRSFGHQYEISIFGKNTILRKRVEAHFEETLKDVEEFDYDEWRKRSMFKRILEIILEPFKHYF